MPTSLLPIHSVLADLIECLAQQDTCILQAPPGAGKTTVVPLALMQQAWAQGKKIILLEPRRLAVRSVAQRLAEQLGEKVGQRVGYRMRLERKVSVQTQIEVVTEGVLLRQLQADPSLSDIALIIFDEFHERSLNADLALALSLSARELFCEQPLKLLIMSATLDTPQLAQALAAPVIQSEGRSYPVYMIYSAPWRRQDQLIERMQALVERALNERQGSLLVFLAGQNEIRQLQEKLTHSLDLTHIQLAPLYGELSLAEQRKAIDPVPAGMRKIVLATNIAETSLTIDDITVVIDSGFERQAVFDAGKGITRLTTQRISKASAEQRAGRAGRLAPGVCYRLYSAEQYNQLEAHSQAQILQADLSPLALQLLSWGMQSHELFWLDQPPAANYQQGLDLLEQFGALHNGQLSPHGKQMARLPLEPRLAHLLLCGQRLGYLTLAAELAALLTERDFRNAQGADLQLRLDALHAPSQQPRIKRIRQLAEQFAKALPEHTAIAPALTAQDALGALLALAFPERIALQRAGQTANYKMANGRGVHFYTADSLQKHKWLVIAELSGQAGRTQDCIQLAVGLNPQLFHQVLSGLVREQTICQWQAQGSFIAEKQSKIGELLLSSQPLEQVDDQQRVQALLDQIRQQGLALLPFTPAIKQWQARVSLLRELELAEQGQTAWPDVGDEYLLEHLEQWLAPYVINIVKLSQLAALNLQDILSSLLIWPQPQQLDELAPKQFSVPSGSTISIDYSQTPPVLAVRLQELFGLAQTPAIANGKQALKLHLLSPARRPVQVTMDLASFWQNTYFDVKKDLQGRYPKHYWPDDPLQAEPTARAKRRPPL